MKYADYREKKQHGTADFPIQCYCVSSEHPQYRMQPHWHREFEIIMVRTGYFQVFLNNACYSCKPGDCVLVSPNVLHWGEPKDCTYDCLVFDLEMLRKSGNEAIGMLLRPLITGNSTANGLLQSSDGELYLAADALFEPIKQQTTSQAFFMFGALYRFFGLLYESNRITDISRRHSARQSDAIMTLLDWIELHLHEPITLAQLSQVSGLSEKYLCRLFREYTTHTPIDYVNRLRVESACLEMVVHHRSVTEAAFEVGFNDLSFFSRTFKKYKGMSPKEYRKSLIDHIQNN